METSFKNIFLLASILVSLTFPNSVFGNVQCKDILSIENIGPVILTNFDNKIETSTVEILNSQPGQHGGSLLTLKRVGSHWLSNYASFNFDVQGDPRWFVAAIGEERARFFGFEILGPQTMIIPDAIEFQNALDKINTHLKSNGKPTIKLTFTADDLEGAPIQGYLDQFTKYKLPFATTGHHLVHDMSFHSGAIFIPNSLIDAAVKRVSFALNFLDHLITIDTDPTLSEEIKSIKKYVKAFLTRGIDNGTAYLNLLLIAEKAQDDSFTIGQINNLMSVMNNSGSSDIQNGVFTSSQLILGSTTKDTYYKNPNYVYKTPYMVNSSFTIRDFTVHMLMQFLTAKTTREHARRAEANIRARKLKEIKAFIESQILIFSSLPLGSDHSLDLAQVFSPELDFSLSPEDGPMLNADDAYFHHDATMKRYYEITRAVDDLLSIQ